LLTKPWDQLSTEEKLEVIRQQIAELFGKADLNVLIFNQQLAKLRERIETLEKRLDQGDSGPSDPQRGDP
jgi:hypothetical protein